MHTIISFLSTKNASHYNDKNYFCSNKKTALMTHKYFIALLTLIFAAACGAARTTTLLNHGWTFSKAGGTWESVGIPHSWNATDGTTHFCAL